jgi:hypothetical protein
MSQAAYDAQSRASLECDEAILGFDSGSWAAVPTVELVDNPRRFDNLWGRISVVMPSHLSALDCIETRSKGQSMIRFALEEAINMSGVSKFAVELNFINRHIGSPNRLYVA